MEHENSASCCCTFDRRKECQWRNLYLDCDDPRDLVRCQWLWKPRWFVLYRFLAAAYTFVMCIFLIVQSSKSLVYFTNWGYVILTLSFIVKYMAVLRHYKWLERCDDNGCMETIVLLDFAAPKQTPFLLQLGWLLSNVAFSSAVLISTVYWIGLAALEPKFQYLTIHAHAVNLVMVFLEFSVTSSPMQFLHFYQPFCFGALYVVFNAFYWASGGTGLRNSRAIYPILDWSRLDVTLPIGVLGCALALTGLHWLFCILTRIRKKIVAPSVVYSDLPGNAREERV